MLSGRGVYRPKTRPKNIKVFLGRLYIRRINHQINDVGEPHVGGFHESLELLKPEHDLSAHILGCCWLLGCQ